MIRFHLGMPMLEFRAYGGGKGGKAPAPPDPYAVSDAQTQSNRETALINAALNRINTNTPLGSQSFRQTGVDPATGVPTYEQNIQLSPEQQQLYDQQTQQNLQLGNIAGGMMGQVAGAYGQPLSTSGLPGLQGNLNVSGPGVQTGLNTSGLPGLPGQGDLNAFRDESERALYDRNTAYLDQQTQRDEAATRARLANQGIVEGSEAYTNAMGDFNRGKEMSYRQARNEAIAGGGAEAERMFGIGSATRGQMYGEALSGGQFANQARAQNVGESLSRAQFGNQARSQGMNELFALRNQPLNEFNSLRTAAPVQMPSFAGPSQVQQNPTDLAGNVYRSYGGQVDIYNAQQSGNNAMMGGLFNLGGMLGSAYLMSDERVKEDIEPVGELNDGTELFSFRYKGSPDKVVGVMAQDVEKTHPAAVKEIGGIKHVHYGKVLAKALEAA